MYFGAWTSKAWSQGGRNSKLKCLHYSRLIAYSELQASATGWKGTAQINKEMLTWLFFGSGESSSRNINKGVALMLLLASK